MEPSWTRLTHLRELAVGDARTIKRDGHQLAVFRTAHDEVHAVANRCPHQGYPLSTGALADGVITCEWHNWKFRLCDGVCTLGGEDVRSYPLRVDDQGAVWVDLAEPPRDEVAPRYYAALDRALDEGDWGQMSRTVARLLQAGEPPTDILGHGVAWAAPRTRHGFDHGLAAAADLAAMLSHAPDDVVPLLAQALSLLAEPVQRRAARPSPAPEPLPAAPEAELRARVEAEDLEGAVGLVRGAVAAGTAPDLVFGWLAHAATDHFLDYGHGLIYVVKAEELLEHIGWKHADAVLSALVTTLVYGTREDRLPYMRRYSELAAELAPRLATWAARTPDPSATLEPTPFVDGSLEDAVAAVAHALDRGVAPTRVARALALAAAERLRRFDGAIAANDDLDNGWLDVTHLLTFADAVHETLRRRPAPDALRGLLQAARFVQHTQPFDRPDAAPWPPPRAGDLEAALRAGDETDALAAVRAAGVGIAPSVRRAATADRWATPIFVAHQVKLPLAGLRLADALRADPCTADRADEPVLAAVRFVAQPMRERRIGQGARQAHAFVRDGRQPRTLLGY